MTRAASQRVDLDVDVTDAAALGERVTVRVTVVLPDAKALPATPIVCFAFPGATYSRRYFMLDLPNAESGGQAEWHVRRGWIFVAVDHLGVGESSLPDASKLLFNVVAAANHAVATEVMRRVREGALQAGFPAIANAVAIGIGQSMGGCLLVIQQARHASFDGIAVLGFSAVHTHPPRHGDQPRVRLPFIPRDVLPGGPENVSLATPHVAVNSHLLALHGGRHEDVPGMRWHFHFDDLPEALVNADMDWTNGMPAWRSATMPGSILWVTAPGAIAAEAASIIVPVLAACGERDVLEDPRMEAKAYRNTVDFSMFICPRMAHMHNFASTREMLWTRIASWGEHVAALKQTVRNWPRDLYSDTY